MLVTLQKTSVQIFKALGYHFFTPTCVLCRLPSRHAIDLCIECIQSLPSFTSSCWQCALPLTDSESTSRCGQCLQHPPSFDRTVALYAYHDPINTLINQLKFHHRLSNAVIFGKLLAEKISQAYANDTFPEMIIPIPLHKKRLRQRGFNQAVEIGKITAKQLHIQLARFNSQRVRNTEPQSLLPQKKRQQNIKAAFSVTNINAKHVAVLDDVVTTTATVNEFCRTLRKAGVEKIDVWCIARTIPGKN